jgi:hypothetical protein
MPPCMTYVLRVLLLQYKTAHFDQPQYEEDIRAQSAAGWRPALSDFWTGPDRALAEASTAKFKEWVLEFAGTHNKQPAHVVQALSVKLPAFPVTFKDQLAVVCSLQQQGKLQKHVFQFLKALILTDIDNVSEPARNVGSKETGQTKTVRRKGAVWPEDGGNFLREASTTDEKPFAEYRECSATPISCIASCDIAFLTAQCKAPPTWITLCMCVCARAQAARALKMNMTRQSKPSTPPCQRMNHRSCAMSCPQVEQRLADMEVARRLVTYRRASRMSKRPSRGAPLLQSQVRCFTGREHKQS